MLPYIRKSLIYKGFLGNVFPLLRYHRLFGQVITKMNKRNSLTPPPCFIYSVDELTKTERIMEVREVKRVDLGCYEMVTTTMGHHIEHKCKDKNQKWQVSNPNFNIGYNKQAEGEK